MNEQMQTTLANLPESPGVYIMRNARGEVIYVGKAVSLRNRVHQYFHPSTLREQPKTRRLVQDIASIDYVLVQDATEALMLECNLIKRHQPHYNILLKDSKHFPYIRIDLREDYPAVELTRRMKKGDKARYFGPYLSATELRATLDAVKKVFPVRSCHKDIPRAITRGERPCLNAQIGLCLAPCTGKISREEYHTLMREVCKFLQGHREEIAQQLRKQMEEAAEELDFEKAAIYRDRLLKVSSIMSQAGSGQSAISTVMTKDLDIIGINVQGDEAAVQLMMMRGGKIIGSEGFMMQGSEQDDQGEWVQSFLQQFYFGGVQLPSAIIVRQRPEEADTLEEIFSEHQGRKVHIEVPVRGERHRLLLMAEKNAAERFHRELNSRQREWERTGGAVDALGKVLGIPAPRRIECYDISNIQGTDSVASMVVFEQGKPARSQYRRFRIKTVEGANDFESMKEVVGRRFRHGQEEQAANDGKEPDGFARFPQLVVIDGGPVQLAFAREAMANLGVDIPAIGLAKRNEEIILPDNPVSLVLDKNTAELHLLQRIRDEAHRFAITYHRSLRTTRALRSQLEEIPGVGPKRRKALLKAFPLPAQLNEATVEELAAVESMNHKAAQVVWEALHQKEQEQA